MRLMTLARRFGKIAQHEFPKECRLLEIAMENMGGNRERADFGFDIAFGRIMIIAEQTRRGQHAGVFGIDMVEQYFPFVLGQALRLDATL